MNCPKCDADISESYEPTDYSVSINGGWYCDACDLGIGEDEVSREPLEDDVYIGPIPRDPSKPLGTPLSELSGRPGDPNDPDDPRHVGYAKFKRIAKSWGYD